MCTFVAQDHRLFVQCFNQRYLEGILDLTSFLYKMLVLINAFKVYPVSVLTTLHSPLFIKIKNAFMPFVSNVVSCRKVGFKRYLLII